MGMHREGKVVLASRIQAVNQHVQQDSMLSVGDRTPVASSANLQSDQRGGTTAAAFGNWGLRTVSHSLYL